MKNAALKMAVGGSSADAEGWSFAELPANFFGLSAKDAKGASVPMSTFQNQVCLLVNVATN